MPERYEEHIEVTEVEVQPENLNYGPSVVIAALDQIATQVNDARAVPLSPNVIVNRAGLLDLVAQARESLPEDLVAADAVVADADAVLARADAAAEVTIAEANAKARALLAESRDKADTMLSEAAEESDRRVGRAQEESAQIRSRTEADVQSMLAKARAEADAMVSEQSVLREAQEQAAQLLHQARTEASELALGADDYAGTTLSQVAQVLSDLQRTTEAGRRAIAERTGLNPTETKIQQ